jgi:hypothetical protein
LHIAATAAGAPALWFDDQADSVAQNIEQGGIVVDLTDTGNGTEDSDMTLSVDTAGSLVNRIFIDGDGGIDLYNGDDTLGVELALNDWGATTDDNQDHVILTSNCTDTGTGAEDCDFTIGVAESGNPPETRIEIDADGGINLGSDNNDAFRFESDVMDIRVDGGAGTE